MNRLSVQRKTWDRPAYTKAAFVFPGQGAFDLKDVRELHQRSQVFKDLLATAEMISHAEGFPNPAALLKENSSDSSFAQNLLLFCYQLALYRELCEKLTPPKVLTSHSFGEYAAFCAAGVLEFSDAYRIVALREAASPPPHEAGSLIAVAAGHAEIDLSRFSRPLFLANRNSPRQTVFAVAKKDLKLILRELRLHRLPARELSSVARPYHSPLMDDARRIFKEHLSQLPFQIHPFRISLISSVTGEAISAETSLGRDQIIDHLARQLTNEVNFIRQVDMLSQLEVDGVVELNLREMTSPFIRDSFPKNDFPVFSAGAYFDEKKIETHVSAFKVSDLKVIEMVSRFISQITGYKIEEIRLEQKLEEDLRIDSIKKAEVLFRTFQERNIEAGANLEVAKLKQVGDIVHLIENLKDAVPSAEKRPIRFVMKSGQWTEIPKPLGAPHRGRSSPIAETSLVDGPFFAVSGLGSKRWVLRLKSEIPLPELRLFLTDIHRALEKIRLSDSGLQTLLLIGKSSRTFQGMKAFLKSWALETDSFTVKSIETASPLGSHELENEFHEISLRNIRYENGRRFSWTLQSASESPSARPLPKHIFSIGGSGGILESFYEAADLPETNLFVVGRRKKSETEIVLQKFKSNFHRVEYRQTDASSWEDLKASFQKAEEMFGPVDLILDASGAQYSQFFGQKSHAEIDEELSSKILPTLHLEKILESRSQKPRYLKLNSIAASHGNAGQSVYGFANDYSCGKEWVTALCLPPTDGVGMTEETATLRTVKMLGIDLLPRDQIAPLFHDILRSPKNHFSLMTPKNEFMLTAQHLPWRWDPTSPGTRRAADAVFERQIDMESLPFLKGHIMLDQCLVPASLYLGQLYVAMKALRQQWPSVDRYELNNLITLEAGPVSVKTRFEFEEPEIARARVSSHLENFVLSSSGSLKPQSLISPPRLRLIHDMNMQDFYSKKFLDLHGTFANLEWVRVTNGGEILGRLASENPPSEVSGECYRMMNLFEACFQVMGASVMWTHHLTVVPAQVVNLKWNSEAPVSVEYILIKELRQVSESRWAAVAQGLAFDGTPVFEIQTLEGEVVVVHESRPIRSEEIDLAPW